MAVAKLTVSFDEMDMYVEMLLTFKRPWRTGFIVEDDGLGASFGCLRFGGVPVEKLTCAVIRFNPLFAPEIKD